jgi:uncharacterized OsmC-like protein
MDRDVARWRRPKSQLILDAPAEASGGDEGPSPAEMLLGAIGA